MKMVNAKFVDGMELMPTYDYECDACGAGQSHIFSIADYEHIKDVPFACPCDKGWARRKFSFSFRMPFSDGYAPTLGRHVTGDRDLREGMRIASAQATERTGIEHNFQPIDVRDHKTLGVTEEGLAADNKLRHDRGEPVIKVPGLDV